MRYLPIFSFLIICACNNKPAAKKAAATPKSDSLFSVKTVSFSPERATLFSTYFDVLYKANHFNGTVLFGNKDSIFQKAYGYTSFRTRDSLSIHTSFQLASVSKTVTAVAVMMLWEQGKINLNKDIRSYLADVPDTGITVQMLLSHRSGLPNYMYLTDTCWPDKSVLMCNNDVITFFKSHKPAPYLCPNTEFNYCNTNYAFLASIVEKVSGMPFSEYLRKKIFIPCGMTHTFLATENYNPEQVRPATGHNVLLEEKEKHYHDGILGDKGLWSSVYDMYLFHKALASGYLLKKSTVAMMCEPQTKPRSYERSYGLGFRMMSVYGKKWIYHNGWWHGFRAYFWNDFQSDKCFIALTNTTRDGYLKEEEILPFLQ